MTCKCGSTLIVSIYGKCSDRSSTSYGNHEHDGYVPEGLGIGGGDDIEFDFCGNCGLIQDFEPLTEKAIITAIMDEEEDDDGY